MPTFNLTNDEATVLVEYFAALSMADSQSLTKSLAPVREYVANAAKPAASEARNDATPPGADWFLQDVLQRPAERLRRFALDRKLMRPRDLEALGADPARLAAAHSSLLERTGFMKDLYAVGFPFVEPAWPQMPTERFETGERFFNDMGCLKCHVLGDMLPGPAKTTDDFVQIYRLDGVRGEGDKAIAILNGTPHPVGSVIDGHKLVSAQNIFYASGDSETKAIVEGPNSAGETERVVLQAPSAPNLDLTYQRLRREWVYQWMLQPGWIQPGTKMPQNFPDKKSPFEGNPKYPGTGLDHANLLVDFLYDAGAKNIRSPLVKSVMQAKAEEFDEEGGKAEEPFEE